jgi:hypothetical protein
LVTMSKLRSTTVSMAGMSFSELGSMNTLSGTRTEVMLLRTSVAASLISVVCSRPSAIAALTVRVGPVVGHDCFLVTSGSR